MGFLPRYSPQIILYAPRQGDARAYIHDALGLDKGATLLPVGSGRVAFKLLLGELARRSARRNILLSAQICPIVPQLIIAAGFRPIFVDVDLVVASSGARDFAEAYQRAGDDNCIAAVIASPIYGYAAADIGNLRSALGRNATIVSDMAQGALIEGGASGLNQDADFGIFSFGLGKGLDTGGGLLVIRDAARWSEPLPSGLAALAYPFSTLGVRAIEAVGLYRWLMPVFERRDEVNAVPESADFDTVILKDDVFQIWAAAIKYFGDDVARARTRAARLFSVHTISQYCAYGEVYGAAQPTHLRQILRLKDAGRRAAVLNYLRAAGIDALSAGEKLPSAYLQAGQYDASHWHNAKSFLKDAIRLPFLGRVSDNAFEFLVQRLEKAIG